MTDENKKLEFKSQGNKLMEVIHDLQLIFVFCFCSGGCDYRMHPINIDMREIKSYIVDKKKRELTLLLTDGSSHAFVFQYGTIQDFTYILRACLKTKK